LHHGQAFPALYDWVSYPITTVIEAIYKHEMVAIARGISPCPYRLELLAAFERLLNFCHTGNTAVLATGLMRPLGLSRGAIIDGFPMLVKLFARPTIVSAVNGGLEIDARNWPFKNGYPAIASKASQIYSYSLRHFMVRLFII
jgi:hypothetical protein